MPVRRDNPYANFNFVVEIDGVESGSFSEVELPEGEIEVVEYREGADRVSSARKLPGRVKYANVVLKRGIAGQTELFEWWKSVRDGGVDRRNVAIVLLDEARSPVQRWQLRDAWPTKLSYSRLVGLGNEVAIETLELAHEGFDTE
jgi:phage tail-like protein